MNLNLYKSNDASFLTEVRMNNSSISNNYSRRRVFDDANQLIEKSEREKIENSKSSLNVPSLQEVQKIKHSPFFGEKSKTKPELRPNHINHQKAMSFSKTKRDSSNGEDWSIEKNLNRLSVGQIKAEMNQMAQNIKENPSTGYDYRTGGDTESKKEMTDKKSEENLDDWEQDLLSQTDTLEEGLFQSLSQKMAHLNGHKSCFASKKPF